MFTLGEVALLKAAKPQGGLTVLLQALTAHNFIPSAASGSQYYSINSQIPQSDAAGSFSTAAGFPTQGPACTTDAQQMLASQAIYAGATQSGTQIMGGSVTQGAPLTQAVGGSRAVPSFVQGHAWIALGKVCLVDEGLAKKCVPLFVQVGSAASRSSVLCLFAFLSAGSQACHGRAHFQWLSTSLVIHCVLLV